MTETDKPREPESRHHSEQLPGARLKAARESRGLTVEDVAARLNISVTYVKDLEASEFDKLPGLAFVKGYIRAYARFVGLSGDELVADLKQRVEPEAEERPVASINKVGRQANLSDPLIRVSVLLFAAALIGISLWWWQGQQEAPVTETAPPAAEAPSPAADPTDIQARLRERAGEAEPVAPQSGTEPGPDEEAEPVYLSDAELERLAQEMAGEPSAPEVEPSAAQAERSASEVEPAKPEVEALVTAQEAEPVATPAAQVLEMTFSGECWIAIRDLDDNLLYASNKAAGETLRYLVEQPVRLLVGRVSAVAEAEFDGEPLDLEAVARRNVARLTLE